MGTTEPKWKEVHRYPIGFQSGEGRAGAWFNITYCVTEVLRRRGEAIEYRERVVYGATLRSVDRPDMALNALLHVVANGASVLSRYCEAEETNRKKATSRSKRGQ